MSGAGRFANLSTANVTEAKRETNANLEGRTKMGSEFNAIFVFILVAIMVALGMFFASYFLGPFRRTPVKQMPYESGMDPIGDARQRFDVRYYLVAIMFLLFDVELLYLYPWAAAQFGGDDPVATATVDADHGVVAAPTAVATGIGIPKELRGLVFGEILAFIAILAAAYVYAWRKGVFEWR